MRYPISIIFLVLTSCSRAPVRSTVDSFGDSSTDSALRRDQRIHFLTDDLQPLEHQAALACQEAAKSRALQVSDEKCDGCVQVAVQTRMAGTQQVIRASPGYGSSWGIFGGHGGGGIGISSQATSGQEAGREINLKFFKDRAQKKPMREIEIRSVGRENSVSAVAYEMCSAAFQDYPQNLEGRFYEIQPREKKND